MQEKSLLDDLRPALGLKAKLFDLILILDDMS